MAKWYGEIGYAEREETVPGVWTDKTTVHKYYGDLIRSNTGWSTNSDSTNDDMTVNCQISIVADPFAYQKFHTMKWVELYGSKWKIKSVEPKHPRLILSLGGVFNGE